MILLTIVVIVSIGATFYAFANMEKGVENDDNDTMDTSNNK